MTLHPLTFEEFLIANGEDILCEFIKKSGLQALQQALEDKLSDYLKLYFIIGGMPSPVKTWLEERDFNKVEEKQLAILETYTQDFSKHAPSSIVPHH